MSGNDKYKFVREMRGERCVRKSMQTRGEVLRSATVMLATG